MASEKKRRKLSSIDRRLKSPASPKRPKDGDRRHQRRGHGPPGTTEYKEATRQWNLDVGWTDDDAGSASQRRGKRLSVASPRRLLRIDNDASPRRSVSSLGEQSALCGIWRTQDDQRGRRTAASSYRFVGGTRLPIPVLRHVSDPMSLHRRQHLEDQVFSKSLGNCRHRRAGRTPGPDWGRRSRRCGCGPGS